MARTTAKKQVKKTADKPAEGKAAKVKLLSGGNPQIAKGYGDTPVQAYIAAMPGWKNELGRRHDALIVRMLITGDDSRAIALDPRGPRAHELAGDWAHAVSEVEGATVVDAVPSAEGSAS